MLRSLSRSCLESCIPVSTYIFAISLPLKHLCGNLRRRRPDLQLPSFNLGLSLELKLANLCRSAAARPPAYLGDRRTPVGGAAWPRPRWLGRPGQAKRRGEGEGEGRGVQPGDRRGGVCASQGKPEQQAGTSNLYTACSQPLFTAASGERRIV